MLKRLLQGDQSIASTPDLHKYIGMQHNLRKKTNYGKTPHLTRALRRRPI